MIPALATGYRCRQNYQPHTSSLDPDALPVRRPAAENRHAARCDAEVVRQKRAQRFVRFAFLGRGGHLDFPGPVRKLTDDLRLRALRDYFNRDVHIWPAAISTGRAIPPRRAPAC